MEDYIALSVLIAIMCLFLFMTGTFLNLYFTAIDLNNALNLVAKRVEFDGGINANTTTFLANLLDGSRIDPSKLTVSGTAEHQDWGTSIYVKLVYEHDMLKLGENGYETIIIPLTMVRVLSSEYQPN